MSAADLPLDVARMAAESPIPVQSDGSPARACVSLQTDGPDHPAMAPCYHRDRWVVVFGVDYGRGDSAPVGPVFDRPEAAGAFARRLNGEGRIERATPTSTTDVSAEAPASVTAGPRAQDTTQDRVTTSTGSVCRSGASCAACGAPLPPSSHHRRCCSARCRQRLSRRGGRTAIQQLSLHLDGAESPTRVGVLTLEVAS